jgi:transcriptional regulator with XRE-family HTH domain
MIQIDAERLSGALRRKRTSDRLTFAEIGGLVGANASTVYRVEAGKGLPSVAVFMRLCDWLARDPRDFVVYEAIVVPDAAGGEPRVGA